VLAVSANAFAYVVFSTTGEQVFPTKTDKSSAGNMVEWYGEFNETRRLRFEYSWRTGAEVDLGGGSVTNPFNVPNDRGMPSSFTAGSCSIKFQKFETLEVNQVYETEYIDRYVAVRQAIVKDQKASGLGGGTFTGFKHEWQARDLNTVDDPLGIGITVAGNVMDIPAGAYAINVKCPATWEAFRCSLYNTDTSTRVAFGTVGGTDGTTTPNSFSVVDYLVNSSTVTHLRVDIQRSSNDTVTCGQTCLGFPMGSHTDPEIYTVVTIVKQKSERDVNSVGTEQIVDGAVTTAKIADGAVTDAKIASVDSTKVVGDLINPVMEMNTLGSGDRNTYIDMHSHGDPNTLDYDARIIRRPGANGLLEMSQRGTGGINIYTENAANVYLGTASATTHVFEHSTKDMQLVNGAKVAGRTQAEMDCLSGCTGNIQAVLNELLDRPYLYTRMSVSRQITVPAGESVPYGFDTVSSSGGWSVPNPSTGTPNFFMAPKNGWYIFQLDWSKTTTTGITEVRFVVHQQPYRYGHARYVNVDRGVTSAVIYLTSTNLFYITFYNDASHTYPSSAPDTEWEFSVHYLRGP